MRKMILEKLFKCLQGRGSPPGLRRASCSRASSADSPSDVTCQMNNNSEKRLILKEVFSVHRGPAALQFEMVRASSADSPSNVTCPQMEK